MPKSHKHSKNLLYKKIVFLACVGFILILVGMTVVATSRQVTLASKAAENSLAICQDLKAKITDASQNYGQCVDHYKSIQSSKHIDVRIYTQCEQHWYRDYNERPQDCNDYIISQYNLAMSHINACDSKVVEIMHQNSEEIKHFDNIIDVCNSCLDWDQKKVNYQRQFDAMSCSAQLTAAAQPICPNGGHAANGACRFQQCFTNNDPNSYADVGFFCSNNKKVSCGNTAGNMNGVNCTDNHTNGKCIDNGADSYCDWERSAAVDPHAGCVNGGMKVDGVCRYKECFNDSKDPKSFVSNRIFCDAGHNNQVLSCNPSHVLKTCTDHPHEADGKCIQDDANNGHCNWDTPPAAVPPVSAECTIDSKDSNGSMCVAINGRNQWVISTCATGGVFQPNNTTCGIGNIYSKCMNVFPLNKGPNIYCSLGTHCVENGAFDPCVPDTSAPPPATGGSSGSGSSSTVVQPHPGVPPEAKVQCRNDAGCSPRSYCELNSHTCFYRCGTVGGMCSGSAPGGFKPDTAPNNVNRCLYEKVNTRCYVPTVNQCTNASGTCSSSCNTTTSHSSTNICSNPDSICCLPGAAATPTPFDCRTAPLTSCNAGYHCSYSGSNVGQCVPNGATSTPNPLPSGKHVRGSANTNSTDCSGAADPQPCGQGGQKNCQYKFNKVGNFCDVICSTACYQ